MRHAISLFHSCAGMRFSLGAPRIKGCTKFQTKLLVRQGDFKQCGASYDSDAVRHSLCDQRTIWGKYVGYAPHSFPNMTTRFDFIDNSISEAAIVGFAEVRLRCKLLVYFVKDP
jgi:hypothetical protein